MPVTILEGPDGAGKTTLAKRLCDDPSLGAFHYHHFGPPPATPPNAAVPSSFLQYLGAMQAIWRDRNSPFQRHEIFDRFVYGELIYGPVFRNDRSLTPWMVRMIERVLLSMETTLVIALPLWDRVYENWSSRRGEEMLKQETQLKAVFDRYAKLAYRSLDGMTLPNVPLQVYDYTSTRPFTFHARSQPNHGPGIGHFMRGNVLLLGEQCNPNTHIEEWPFIAVNGSSAWLTQQLEYGRVPEANLYWANVKRLDGAPLNPRFIDELEPSAIVALGAEARKWAERYVPNLRCEPMPHPSYWKRFNGDIPYPLIPFLQETLRVRALSKR